MIFSVNHLISYLVNKSSIADRKTAQQETTWIGLEPLEPRVLLSTNPTFAADLPDPVVDAPIGKINGIVFEDHDRDGLQDFGDKGLAHRLVYLDQNGNGERDEGELGTATDVSGRYQIRGLEPGDHKVTVRSGSKFTSSLTDGLVQSVTLTDENGASGIGFGLRRVGLDLSVQISSISMPGQLVIGRQQVVPLILTNVGDSVFDGMLKVKFHLSWDTYFGGQDDQKAGNFTQKIKLNPGKSTKLNAAATIASNKQSFKRHIIAELAGSAVNGDVNSTNNTAVSIDQVEIIKRTKKSKGSTLPVGSQQSGFPVDIVSNGQSITQTQALSLGMIPVSTEVASSEIDVQGNNISIADNSTDPSLDNFTDFHQINVNGGSTTRQFTIHNNGIDGLNLSVDSAVRIIGASPSDHLSDFAVAVEPTNLSIGPGGSTSFIVSFTPTGEGLRTAKIQIESDATPDGLYEFNIQGIGLDAQTFEDPEAAGLMFATSQKGTGPEATAGDALIVDYTGYLLDGFEFDSSVPAARDPLRFVLGAGGFIPGWSLGMEGIKVGEKRTIIIPPELGYGSSGIPPAIPPDATLVFELERIANAPFLIQGNAISISDGDTNPSLNNFTDFHQINMNGGSTTREFTIINSGTTNHHLTQDPIVRVTGEEGSDSPGDFTVLTPPPNVPIIPGGSTSFTVAFSPTGDGLRTARIEIQDDTAPDGIYSFNIHGRGLDAQTFDNPDATGLLYATTKEGSGSGAKNGDSLIIDYSGYLIDGVMFETSLADGEEPLDFVLGEGDFTTGWNLGLEGIKKGEKRTVIIPPELGYGNDGQLPTIPSGATLVFEITRLSNPITTFTLEGNETAIRDGDNSPNLEDFTDFHQINTNGGSTTREFTIRNSGDVELNLIGDPFISIVAEDDLDGSEDFMVTTMPDLATIAPGGSTSFVVDFAPTVYGLHTARIEVLTDANHDGIYDFKIQGTGLKTQSFEDPEADGLLFSITEEGIGSEATLGDFIRIDYSGFLLNGEKFDSNIGDDSDPMQFMLGSGDFISGWELGLVGIKTGEKRTLIIPPDLGYGDTGSPSIPPGSILVFELARIAPNITTFISGRVWHDADSDARQDSNEESLAGKTVYLDQNRNHELDEFEPNILTEGDGTYRFENLLANHKYIVRVDPPADWTTTFPATMKHKIELAEISRRGVRFGIAPSLNSEVGGKIWHDFNNNREHDLGETGIAGVTILLTETDGSTPLTTITDTDGTYRFVDLTPGSLQTLEVELLDGWEFSKRSSGKKDLTIGNGKVIDDLDFNMLARPIIADRNNGISIDVETISSGLPASINVIGVTDADSKINQVLVYHDINGDRELDPRVDNLVGLDRSGTEDYSIALPTNKKELFSSSMAAFFVVVQDEYGNVNPPPRIVRGKTQTIVELYGGNTLSYQEPDGTIVHLSLNMGHARLALTGNTIGIWKFGEAIEVVGETKLTSIDMIESVWKSKLEVTTSHALPNGDLGATVDTLTGSMRMGAIVAPNLSFTQGKSGIEMVKNGVIHDLLLRHYRSEKMIMEGRGHSISMKMNLMSASTVELGARLKRAEFSVWAPKRVSTGSPTFTAPSAGTIRVTRRMEGPGGSQFAQLNLTKPDVATSLGKLIVGGSMVNFIVTTASSINYFNTQYMIFSALRAGMDSTKVDFFDQPTDADHFTREAKINEAIAGTDRKRGPHFIDSYIAGWQLDRVIIWDALHSNESHPFGLTYHTLESLKYRQPIDQILV